MISWTLANKQDNPLYAKFDRGVAILKKYDVVPHLHDVRRLLRRQERGRAL